MRNSQGQPAADETLDVVIVGAGFAGLYMLLKCGELGLTARALEAGSDVGGTWFWNRYPGARCDVESMQYSFSFSEELQQEWRWSERYAAQPEILRYARHVAERFDLLRSISFETRVVSASFDEASARWTLATNAGGRVSARFCVMATGCLSSWRTPDIEGMASFRSKTYHTGRWPHEGVDFTGQRVGLIGTGSSAIQSIPVIAAQAAHLHVFQRTPNFSVPAHNWQMTAEYADGWRNDYAALREKARSTRSGILYDFPVKSALEAAPEERETEYAARWAKGGINFLQAYNDILLSPAANETAAGYIRMKIGEIVHDPDVARKLMPTDYPVGTKRICVDTDYFATFNRPNVTLVDIRDSPIEKITDRGLRAAGEEYEFDSIVFATGFDAMTGALLNIEIEGRGGERLADKWAHGPHSYLGLMMAGFPNLFTVTGPGSPSVLSNMIVSIEQHVEWIAGCLGHLSDARLASIEPEREAEDRWVEHVNDVAAKTLYPRAASWYMGANIPGKPRVFMPYCGGVGAYRGLCDEIAKDGYRGFRMTPARAAAEQAAD